ncbi:hypothetical protein N7486_007722 [Penicillium sp. IBT 16267x]|nr:hypothetical protein N7486_007722 [Penicillium sp. IBT 16267x]
MFGFTLMLLLPLVAAASRVPYEEYILAPSSRNLNPTSVYQVNGSVTNVNSLTQSSGSGAIFNGISSVTLDFGKNVAGLVSLDVKSASSSSAFLSVTFTESSLWISSEYSDATGNSGFDRPLWFNVGKGAGTYTPATEFQRGAFRYLTVASNTSATVILDALRVNLTSAPDQDLRGYTGWFHSDDELINRIWYAGAYTNQLCTIEPTAGDAITSQSEDVELPEMNAWYNNYTITNGTSTITDGAKRDRLVWPGDMAISLESIAVSTGDLYSIRMGLESLFILQQADGRLPYAGTPFYGESYTYHLHNLIGMSFLYRFSGDKAWALSYWDQYVLGVKWALESVDSTGLANVTLAADWLRFGMGGHNIEANSILYFVLNDAQELAKELNKTSVIPHWASVAAGVKTAANKLLWDSSAGMYRDNQTTTLHPQDGNAWAIKANITQSETQRNAISAALKARWGTYGAPAPEAGATISPFIGGFELQAHYIAGQPNAALDLLRLQWGYMLLDSKMTQSTFIEGYSTDGSIHYAPYIDDARISHAHGWSTGPTYALTAYAAGIRLTGPAGKSWKIAPQPGNLTTVDAGLATARGVFSVALQRSSSGEGYGRLSFSTPSSTTGVVQLPGVEGTLISQTGQRVRLVDGTASVPGGKWKLQSS